MLWRKTLNTKLKKKNLLSNNIKQYDVERRQDFYKNEETTKNFRFCLVMENTYKMGYITEKIYNAFSGGCIPIFYGTEDIFRIFNEKAFIFFNITNPSKALNRISMLENDTEALKKVKEEPIFRNPRVLHEYLNLNGKIKQKIRAMLENKDTCK